MSYYDTIPTDAPEHLIAFVEAVKSANMTVESPWVSYRTPIAIKCAQGHEYTTTPHNFYRTKKCIYCIDDMRPSGVKRRLIAKQRGYDLTRMKGSLQQWVYTCQTCGTGVKRHPNAFENWAPCKECKAAGDENQNIMVALDCDPFYNALVFIGRTPMWLMDIVDSGKIKIEPVFATVNTFRPDHFFTKQDEGYADITHTDVDGITWMPGATASLSDNDIRELTLSTRLSKQRLMTHAIDFVSGRDSNSRYAGDDGYLVINTEDNQEFVEWNETGMPVYSFGEPDKSPLWEAFVKR